MLLRCGGPPSPRLDALAHQLATPHQCGLSLVMTEAQLWQMTGERGLDRALWQMWCDSETWPDRDDVREMTIYELGRLRERGIEWGPIARTMIEVAAQSEVEGLRRAVIGATRLDGRFERSRIDLYLASGSPELQRSVLRTASRRPDCAAILDDYAVRYASAPERAEAVALATLMQHSGACRPRGP